jgi:preprotein translocase subunit SecG
MRREYLLLLLGLVFMVLSIATSLLASERVVEKHTEKTTHIGDNPMLIPVKMSNGYTGVLITRLVLENNMDRIVRLSVSCIDKSIGVEIPGGLKEELLNLTPPCWIMPLESVNLNITVEFCREVMPYSWLVFPSILFLLLSLGLVFMFTYHRVLEKTLEKHLQH